MRNQIEHQEFFIDGKPEPQGRGRASTYNTGKRKITVRDPEKSRKWKQDVVKQAKSSRVRLMEGPLRVVMTFYMPRPKSLPKRVLWHVKKPDVDNLCKAVGDALNGIAYNDDSQIVRLKVFKRYAFDRVGVSVSIERLERVK